MRWNARTATVAEVQAAQAGANASLKTANALSELAGAASTARLNIDAHTRIKPPGVSGVYQRLTHQGMMGGVTLGSGSGVTGGQVWYAPTDIEEDIPIVQFIVEIVAAGTAGNTMKAYMARYSVKADGTPDALIADYSAGFIDISGAAVANGTGSAVFTQIIIPRGRWHIATRFDGTAGAPSNPTLRMYTNHPSVGCGAMQSITVCGGYRSPDNTNVAFPPNAVVNTTTEQGRGGLRVDVKRA